MKYKWQQKIADYINSMTTINLFNHISDFTWLGEMGDDHDWWEYKYACDVMRKRLEKSLDNNNGLAIH